MDAGSNVPDDLSCSLSTLPGGTRATVRAPPGPSPSETAKGALLDRAGFLATPLHPLPEGPRERQPVIHGPETHQHVGWKAQPAVLDH